MTFTLNNATKTSPSSRWLSEFDIYKGIAIISVVAIHSTSIPIEALPQESSSFWMFFILNKVIQYSVPMFFLMSALLEAYSIRQRKTIDWMDFYHKKAKRILFPYLLWTVLYMSYYSLTDQTYLEQFSNPSIVFRMIFWGKSAYHLYFLVILIQFYMIFPLLLKLVKKLPENIILDFIILYGIQLSIYYLLRFFNVYHYFNDISTTIFWYFFITACGMVIGLKYDQLRPFLHKYSFLIVFLIFLSGIYFIRKSIYYYKVKTATSLLFFPSWYLYTALMSIIFIRVSLILKEKDFKLKKLLMLAGKNSFGIYLIHPIILDVLKKYTGILKVDSIALYNVMVVLVFVAVLFVSYMVSSIIQSKRYLSWLVGIFQKKTSS